MSADSPSPWHPHRSWADPLIALLTLLALLAAGLSLRARQQRATRPSERVSLQGRLMEVALAGPRLLSGTMGKAPDWAKAEAQLKEPWDRALLAVLQAELDAPKEGRAAGAPGPERAAPEGLAGVSFRRACLAAYAGEALPEPSEREEIHRRLGNGHGADLLEARLRDRDREGGGDLLRAQTRRALRLHLAGLGFLGILVVGLGAGGLGVGIYLVVNRRTPPLRPLPAWSLSDRAAALVFLGWFLGFFLAGNLTGLFLLPWPGLRWMIVPLGSLLHMAFGLRLLCWAEGISPTALWRRVAPGPVGRDLAWGGAFLALAVLLVIVVALISSLILKPDQSPQRELQELLRSLSGWGPGLMLFLVVALLAPFFEELLFRGFLLPVLARHQGMVPALILSSLLFGAIHLQPAGLPTLGSLGLAMGLAMRHTGSLRTPILVHACWNGGLFLLMRAFA